MITQRRLAFIVALVGSAMCVAGAYAQVTYQIDALPFPSGGHEIFNNSQGTETEDCWVANSFTVVTGGTHITALNFVIGSALTNRSVTATLYTGTSLTNPSGLSRIVASTTTTTVTGTGDSVYTINLASPVDLSIGDIFYAALLMPSVPGSLFPYSSDAQNASSPTPLGRSFFDVGATQGAAYNLDVTTNATVLGAEHPVVHFAQSAANLALRVTATPEPGTLTLLGLALMGVIARRRRPVV
jgi:hypothetical protein